jgi:hypothetical protein
MLLAYIHRSITHRVHFLDKARPGPLAFKANDHGKANQCDTQRPADQPININ